MRAVVLRDGRLDVREIADPVPGHGELLLRTLSTAICASDVHFMDHPAMGVNDPTGRSLYDANRDIVLGHEFVGEVVGHGPGCTEQFPVGTRVTSIPIRLVNGGTSGIDGARIIGQHPDAQGSFGELVVVTEALAKPVDGQAPNDAVALTDAFAVGEFYVRSARMEQDEVPIVIGAGAVGLSAVVALANRGVEPIIVSDYNSERRELARADFGAHIVGASGLIQKIVESVDMGTRIYCAGGWYTGDSLSVTDATRQGVTIQFGGGPHPQDWYGTLDAIASGRLDPLPSVGAIVGLDEVPDAIELARKSDGPPRIIVHPNGDAV
jgi:threonine dehydrogenase-like Zn-dependent dehydrogenase